MADKLMYIPNDDTQNYPYIDYNQLLKKLDTQPNEKTNKSSIRVSKAVKPTNKKTLGTSVIISPKSPPSPNKNKPEW